MASPKPSCLSFDVIITSIMSPVRFRSSVLITSAGRSLLWLRSVKGKGTATMSPCLNIVGAFEEIVPMLIFGAVPLFRKGGFCQCNQIQRILRVGNKQIHPQVQLLGEPYQQLGLIFGMGGHYKAFHYAGI